ncbi:MAG TPA: MmgE/PrpD family protein [Pseudonocardiaceae bacterium]|jgi:2-methylcitrate dehydratase|nr:MmgE/PrpD family protein [Pseudonocardiaceae bacterium]
MDSTTERIVEYALSYSRDDLTEAVTTATVNHLVDTVAVAIAGTTAQPAQAAVRLARAGAVTGGATVIGAGIATAPDLAAFANSVMVRTYDWNDGMQAKGGGHPSDMIPGLFAVAETVHSSGLDLMIATALAYELLGGLGSVIERGPWDQGLFMGGATALAAGRLLGLDKQRLGEAASLAYTTAMPLSVHRWGALSMMKGASTAFSVRNGVFCALLAREGLTSAPEAIEGCYGLAHITGEIVPKLPVLPGGPSVIEMAHQKPLPAESQVLGLLDVVPRIRAWADVADIESIDVEVSERAARHVADPPKYDPRTRETADHSLPYLLAVALVDGEITLDSYRPERFLDPALRPVMNKIRVRPNEEFTRIRTEFDGVTRAHPVRVTFRTTDGRERTDEVRFHKGHFRDPMTRADLDHKFDLATAGLVPDARRDEIRAAWWDIGSAPDAAAPIGMLATLDGAR